MSKGVSQPELTIVLFWSIYFDVDKEGDTDLQRDFIGPFLDLGAR